MTHSETRNRIVALQRRGDAIAAQAAIDASITSLTEAELSECNGNQCFLARRFQEAVNHYEHAMTIDDSYDVGRYHYLLGIQDEQSGDLPAAFTRYQACIELEPEFPDAYTELGGLLMKVSDFEGALHCYEDALQREPNNLGNYQNLVAVLEKLSVSDRTQYGGRLKEAQQCLREAEARLPQSPSGHSW